MSFGKDNSHLNNIPTYGATSTAQAMSTASARRPRGGGGGGGQRTGNRGEPYWRNNFDMLSENPAVPETFRLIRGAYEQYAVDGEGNVASFTWPYLKIREHYHVFTSKGAICSAGPQYLSREHREPCEGCEIYWEDQMERRRKRDSGDNSQGPRRISMSDKYVFSVLDYGIYFEMPSFDRNGQPRMDRNGKQYTTWEKALNPRDPRYAGRQQSQYEVRPWMIPDTWFETLKSWNAIVGKSCSTCCTRDAIASHGWHCGNPNCKAMVFDPNNTTLTVEQQATLTNNLHQCQSCGFQSFLEENISCYVCQSRGTVPRRADIFDVSFQGFKQAVGNGNQKTLVILSHSDPHPLDDYYNKPLDLAKKFTPHSVEQQRDMWKLQAPPGYGQASPGYVQQGLPLNQPQQPNAQPQYVDPAQMAQQLSGYNPNQR